MHPRIIAERQARASKRVLAAVEQIAANTHVTAPALAGIRENSPDVQRIKEWEALADWLEGLALGTAKATEPPVTVETVKEEPLKTTETVEIQEATPAKTGRKVPRHAKN